MKGLTILGTLMIVALLFIASGVLYGFYHYIEVRSSEIVAI